MAVNKKQFDKLSTIIAKLEVIENQLAPCKARELINEAKRKLIAAQF